MLVLVVVWVTVVTTASQPTPSFTQHHLTSEWGQLSGSPWQRFADEPAAEEVVVVGHPLCSRAQHHSFLPSDQPFHQKPKPASQS